ncbi:MAG TPA: phosphate ABC transporter permease subunit PstC, partial [Candidatus Omnitrophota bacterium]|nr:phosphate ABC transporter permease subunit PstC [Candidatus Omnitrophota bacterium]
MKSFKEFLIEKLILVCGLACIFFVALIFLFLLKEGLAVFGCVKPFAFLLGDKWYPISDPPQLGIMPLILGSLLVTLGAAFISVPIGVGCAIYIAEVAPPNIKEFLKAGIELLAAILSVVLGFIGMVTL